MYVALVGLNQWFYSEFFFFSFFSPGRSPSCYDHEIIMMNHVYKERFPKVRTHKTLQFCLTTKYLHYQLAPSLLSAGHGSDGGKDSGDHPQQLSWDRPPLGRWRAWLCPSPDNWTGPRLPGKESAGTHHLQLLLRTHRQAGEACTRGENICRNHVDVSSWQFSNKTCLGLWILP